MNGDIDRCRFGDFDIGLGRFGDFDLGLGDFDIDFNFELDDFDFRSDDFDLRSDDFDFRSGECDRGFFGVFEILSFTRYHHYGLTDFSKS